MGRDHPQRGYGGVVSRPDRSHRDGDGGELCPRLVERPAPAPVRRAHLAWHRRLVRAAHHRLQLQDAADVFPLARTSDGAAEGGACSLERRGAGGSGGVSGRRRRIGDAAGAGASRRRDPAVQRPHPADSQTPAQEKSRRGDPLVHVRQPRLRRRRRRGPGLGPGESAKPRGNPDAASGRLDLSSRLGFLHDSVLCLENRAVPVVDAEVRPAGGPARHPADGEPAGRKESERAARSHRRHVFPAGRGAGIGP